MCRCVRDTTNGVCYSVIQNREVLSYRSFLVNAVTVHYREVSANQGFVLVRFDCNNGDIMYLGGA